MRFAHFFIDRPIFATVLSVLVVLIGAIAYRSLPVAQYPEIAPPTIQVRATYPGANAETIAATLATPLEQEINGVENMLYMSSYSTSDGQAEIGDPPDQHDEHREDGGEDRPVDEEMGEAHDDPL